MKILVTGGTGFIGQHVIKELLISGHNITCINRNQNKIKTYKWFDEVDIINIDIYNDIFKTNQRYDALIHLAWSGLPNYQSPHHLKKNLFGDKFFLRSVIDNGINQLLVTGTCLEFGKKNGPLSPTMPCKPENPYAIAKDKLRKWLELKNLNNDFILQWVRLFYMYGKGQNPQSIIAQLDKAIDEGKSIFNMSKGEQLRDYLAVEDVAKFLVDCIVNQEREGIIHCCSEKPISIRELVEKHIKKRKAEIKLNLGYYPYPEHEAMSFWGVKN